MPDAIRWKLLRNPGTVRLRKSASFILLSYRYQLAPTLPASWCLLHTVCSWPQWAIDVVAHINFFFWEGGCCHFFPYYFCCPRSRTFLLLEGYIMGLHRDVLPSLDSHLSSLELMGFYLIHLAVHVHCSGHILYTIVSRLGSCCKFSPLVSLLYNNMGVRSTRVRTIVCTPWISPCRGLNPFPTKGPSQTPLLLVFIGTDVTIQPCMSHRPNNTS